ncbi:MAG: hypothetical protein E7483_05410 [Ruminococcaceae bacterium]|nr:hypothetical protein [Oscillospiraceae bacterium]
MNYYTTNEYRRRQNEWRYKKEKSRKGKLFGYDEDTDETTKYRYEDYIPEISRPVHNTDADGVNVYTEELKMPRPKTIREYSEKIAEKMEQQRKENAKRAMPAINEGYNSGSEKHEYKIEDIEKGLVNTYIKRFESAFEKRDDEPYYDSRPITDTGYIKTENRKTDIAGTAGREKTKYSGFDRDMNTLLTKYGHQLMGESRLQKSVGANAQAGQKTLKPKKEKSSIEKIENQSINYAQRGRSLFEWMDDFSQNKGPNNETAKVFNLKKEKSDLTAGAQAKSHFRNPILGYEEMINPPDDNYRHNDTYWNEKASNDNIVKKTLNIWPGLKAAEIDKIVQKPVEYVPYIAEFADVKFSDKSAANTRNKVFTEYVGGYDEYGLNMDGGIPNAFMHIYLAAKMTDFLGEENTREFLTAHETFTDKQYEKGFLYQQDDIGFDTDVFPQYQKYDKNKEYPLVKHHAEMDLHNNDIGIKIALTTPTDAAEIEQQLEMYLGENETLDDLRIMFDGYSDREILFMKKAINAVYSGVAAVIWDYPGNNFSE